MDALTDLSIYNSGTVTDNGFSYLIDGLEVLCNSLPDGQAPPLKFFAITNNPMTDEAVEKLVDVVMPRLTNLEVFYGGKANYTDTAAKLLGGVIASSLPNLKQYSIDQCHITSEGVEALAKAFTAPDAPKGVTHLWFCDNPLGDAGIIACAPLIETFGGTLQTFDASLGQYKMKGWWALLKALNAQHKAHPTSDILFKNIKKRDDVRSFVEPSGHPRFHICHPPCYL
jgi:hypothetical protein